MVWNKGNTLSEEHKRKISENHSKYWKGKIFSEEHKRKISEALKGHPSWSKGNIPWNKGIKQWATHKPPMLGRHLSDETKRKISASQIGKSLSEETKRKMSENARPWNKGKHLSKIHKKRISDVCRGKSLSEEHKRKISEAIKNGGSWNKGKYHSNKTKRKMSEARKHQIFPTHHTKPELKFEEICKKYNLPYRYVGDGKLWIENINPDFVESNGKKIAVEIFGTYWHSPLLNPKIRESGTLSYRERALKKYGWKLIVFWEDELKSENAEKIVMNRTMNFGGK